MALPSIRSSPLPGSSEPQPPPNLNPFNEQLPMNFHLNNSLHNIKPFEPNHSPANFSPNGNYQSSPSRSPSAYPGSTPYSVSPQDYNFFPTNGEPSDSNSLSTKGSISILDKAVNPPKGLMLHPDHGRNNFSNQHFAPHNNMFNSQQNSSWTYRDFNGRSPYNPSENDSICSSRSSSSGPASSDENEPISDFPFQALPDNSGHLSSFGTPITNLEPINNFLSHKSSLQKLVHPNISNLLESQPKRARKHTPRYQESLKFNKRRKTREKSYKIDNYNSVSPVSSSFSGNEYTDQTPLQNDSSRSITSQDSNPFFETPPSNHPTGKYSQSPSPYENWNPRPAKGRPPRGRSTSNSNQNEAFYIGRSVRTVKRAKSLRERKNVPNYAEIGAEYESDDDDDKAVDTDRLAQEAEQAQVPSVDRVLNSRINPETNLSEYLIKWKNQAHIHNTWDTYEMLRGTHGIKKVDNFIRRFQENELRRSTMTPDEIEQEDISYELQKQLDDDANIAERVVEASTDPETNVPVYLVKWTSSPYDQCTWETEDTLIKHNVRYLIDDFHARQDRIQGDTAMQSDWNSLSLSRTKFEPYVATPFYMKKADKNLRDYQLIGLNWMVSRMKHGLSLLLADEMGLGKTVQTISLIGHMIFSEHLIGPYLVIVPQSTIDNWLREFHYWLPEINAVCLHGNAMGRDMLRFYELRQITVPNKGTRWRFDVCITTPSILNSLPDVDFLRKIYWQLMVVDEAHQLKNRNSKRFQELRHFQAEYKLLLSGTPLHNNLEEMWTLLHFLNPLKYSHYEEFRRKYPDIENTAAIGEAKQRQLANLQSELHEVVLRRVKKDVEKSLPNKVESILQVEMSPYQEQWYENVYTRNYDQLAKTSGGARNSLQNICMELKKVCNHPFLCSAPLSDSHYQSGLVQGSGKMCLLEKLLFRLKDKGHRVLIFSQMVRMLNLLSEYLTQKGFKHQRLDGSMGKEMRKKAMDHFNAPDSDDFVFLLSTKAGGLGINLTSADTVIIYDSDWNPQNDLQAEARAHRIGQTKTVQIYRLVTKNSIEQSILERAKTKMVLDTLVVQGLNKKNLGTSETLVGASSNTSFTREELSRILKFGAQNLWKRHEVTKRTLDQTVDVDLDKILEEAQITTNEDSGIADNLLSSFNNITEFRYEPTNELADNINDKDFWTSAIPLEERLKYQKLKEQELLVSGPRRTRARDMFIGKSGDDEEYIIEDVEIGSFETKKKSAKIKKKSNSISEKDRYRIYRSLLRFGTTQSRLDDIHEDSRLVRFDRTVIESECNFIIDLCRRRLQEIGYKYNNDEEESSTPVQSVNDDAKNDDSEEMGKNSNFSRHFVAIGENKANAVDLVERVELLSMLDGYIRKQNPHCSEPWKLPSGLLEHPGRIKPPLPEFLDKPLILTLPEKVNKKLKEWTAKDVRKWGPLQDINLIRGTYIYGFGAWNEVYTDPNLDLEQIKDIKYDKVKMRALRTLKLLQNAINESQSKNKKRTSKTDSKLDNSLTIKLDVTPSESPLLSSNNTSFSSNLAPHTSNNVKRSKNKHKQESHEPSTTKQPSEPDGTEPLDLNSFLASDLTLASPHDLKHHVKLLFKPLRKKLKRLKSLFDKNHPQTEIINRMKRLLPILGDIITDTLRLCTLPESSEIFYDACWNYLASFTFASPEDLQRVYLDLYNLRGGDEKDSNIPPTTDEKESTKREE